MVKLTERTEIAEALNFGKYPVLAIDLSKCDEYGLVGGIARIDMGEFDDGAKWYERAQLRVYYDEKRLAFTTTCYALTAELCYSDFIESVDAAMAPIIKPDSEFVVVIHDSARREVYAVYRVATGKVTRHCTCPISLEAVDMTNYLVMAGARYAQEY